MGAKARGRAASDAASFDQTDISRLSRATATSSRRRRFLTEACRDPQERKSPKGNEDRRDQAEQGGIAEVLTATEGVSLLELLDELLADADHVALVVGALLTTSLINQHGLGPTPWPCRQLMLIFDRS